MKLSKSKILALASWLVAFLAYILLVFILAKPENRITSFWIGFSFSVVAFIITLFVLMKGIKVDNLLLSYPVYKLCIGYYLAQLIFGSIFVIFVVTGITWVIAIEVLLLAIFVILFFALGSTNEIIKKQEKEIKIKRQIINELKDKLDVINHEIKIEEVNKAIDKLAEQVRYSDPMSNEAVSQLDDTISLKIGELDTIDKNDKDALLAIIDELSFAIKQRSVKLKNSK